MSKWDYDYGNDTDDGTNSGLNSVRMANNTNSRTVDWLYHNSDEESYKESSVESDGTNDEYINKYKTYPRCYSRRESINSNLNATMPITNSERDIATARLSRTSMSSGRRKSANTMYLHFPKPFSRAGSRMSSMLKSERRKKRCIKRNRIFKSNKANVSKKPVSKAWKLFRWFIIFILILIITIPTAIYFKGNINEMLVESKFKPIPGLYDPRSMLGKNRIQTIQVISAYPT
ncbi:hypothetical protein BMR1_03g02760 [Babesia microti strain RI]|uniref:Uncharacterized protein n=1 Tax=Babesia microti (strain RI) TaxID=1133968 RepID=A0A0K3ANP7_BABMR|nr:hypothetical protein BMR1_03g02760 [Babesia microti strain RI]CTQ41152.1 hypothetical protein BMR1_03g02760 [Babesia microti strain RI]|eukprot:XP_012649163.1 hypothetical protein BMR1_03g02760 [Babesia microti strain RI]